MDLAGVGTHGTTRLAGKTKNDLKYGASGLSAAFAKGTATQGLTTATMQYLQRQAAGKGGKKSVTVKVKVTK
jgi:hypothetical protein